jgi:hypothetical protein
MKLYQSIAQTIQAFQTCEKTCNWEWMETHKETIAKLSRELPSGSGIDNGCEIDVYSSKPNRLVITFSFHHMDENGYYDGWTEHKAIVRPSLCFGIDLHITGPHRNQIKDYLHETLEYALTQETT